MTQTSKIAEDSSPAREVAAYLAIVYPLALAIAVALPHAHINLLLSVLVPTVAVTILTFTMFKRGTRLELWRSISLGRAGLASWLPALFVPVLLCGAAYGTAMLLGTAHLVDIHITAATATHWTINLAINLVITTLVLMGEEIGWRGYMLPRMQQLVDKRRAALLTGFAHGLFHLPLILLATTYDLGGTRWITAPAAVVTITAGGVFYAWLRDRSASVWPVALAHSSVDTAFDLGASAVAATSPAGLAYVAGETGFATMAACLVLAGVLLMRARVWRTPQHPAPTPRELPIPVTAA